MKWYLIRYKTDENHYGSEEDIAKFSSESEALQFATKHMAQAGSSVEDILSISFKYLNPVMTRYEVAISGGKFELQAIPEAGK